MIACVLADLRLRLFDHLQQLSLSFYAREQAGQILLRFSGDLVAAENALVSALPLAIEPSLDILASTACSSWLEAGALSHVEENVSGLPVVKAFGLERSRLAGLALPIADLRRSTARVTFIAALVELGRDGRPRPRHRGDRRRRLHFLDLVERAPGMRLALERIAEERLAELARGPR